MPCDIPISYSSIRHIIRRPQPPQPWAEGDNIPWNDPDFSRRMLAEHLSQEHDLASRRVKIIDKQIDWIHRNLLAGQPTRILDLGCGPGFYMQRLAKLGHQCRGIDYSPASIEYARQQAEDLSLNCDYVLEDLRTADFSSGFGLAMLIFGEFNVFRKSDIKNILRKVHASLNDDGVLLLEASKFEAIENLGRQNVSWSGSDSGLFSEKPHLCLIENTWHEQDHCATRRYFIVDAATANVTRYAQTFQAYEKKDYESLLRVCGFGQIEFFEYFGSVDSMFSKDLIVITARKRPCN
jgi:SAM-dependent methyltransferase